MNIEVSSKKKEHRSKAKRKWPAALLRQPSCSYWLLCIVHAVNFKENPYEKSSYLDILVLLSTLNYIALHSLTVLVSILLLQRDWCDGGGSCLLLRSCLCKSLTPSVQNVGCFDFSRFIYFVMYLDICYIKVHRKYYESKKAKTIYILKRREYVHPVQVSPTVTVTYSTSKPGRRWLGR